MSLAARLIKETTIAVSGLPILTAVIAASCEVVDGASRATNNKEAFKRLAGRVSELSEAVALHCDDLGSELQYSTDFLLFLEELGGKVSEILQFVELHAHQSRFRALLRQDQDAVTLSRFEEDIRQALHVFQVQAGIFMQGSELEHTVVLRQSDVLRTLESQAHEIDEYLGERSPTRVARPRADASPGQRPRLPARPAFLFGRDSEMDALVGIICDEPSKGGRAAILGAPGIGKTSLALSILHHPRVVQLFGDRRLFVACDPASSTESLLQLLLGAAGVSSPRSTRAAQKAFVAWLTEKEGPTLLILDNFESAWELQQTRTDVESLLATLSGASSLSMVLTMRGAERPGGVAWTQPFTPVLSPLDEPAVHQVFTSIVDADADADMKQLLALADGLPLVVVLLATMAQSETCGSLLQRWNEARTALLDRGSDRLSSLGCSITLSLQSPRVRSHPSATAILSLLSLLPDGLRQADVGAALPGVPNLLRCISVLLRSSLAYSASLVDGRIRVLAPIRAFMLQHHPPPQTLLKSLYEHYVVAAEAFKTYPDVDSAFLEMIAYEQGNFDTVIRSALHHHPNARTVGAVNSLALFYWRTRIGPPRLVEAALEAARILGDRDLQVDTMICAARYVYAGIDPVASKTMLSDARELAIEVGYGTGRVLAVGLLARMFGQFLPEAEVALLELRGGDNVELLVDLLLSMANALMRELQLDRAASLYQEAIDIFQSMTDPDPSLYARALGELGEIFVARGRTREALKLFETALPLTRQRISQPVDEGDCHRQIGMAYISLGEHRRGLHYLSTALSLYRTGRAAMLEVAALVFISWSQVAIGDLSSAESSLTAANTAVLKIDQWKWGRTMCSYAWSDISLYRGDVVHARVVAQTARDTFRRDQRLEYEATAIRKLGTIEQTRGEHIESADLFLLAAVINRKTQEFVEMIFSLNMLADAWFDQGDEEASIALTQAILPHLCRLGNGKELADARARFSELAFKRGDEGKGRNLCEIALREYDRLEWGVGIQRCNSLLMTGRRA